MRRFLQVLLGFALAFGQQWPLHDNGQNEVVQWDHYSLVINGRRLFMWSGEIHYWRVPVPELWIDILQKIKAAGFNTVGLYAHWGWHSPAPDHLDFETGAHNFSRIFDIAKDLGLYILFRPGPYINAETNAGGFPGWLLTGDYGSTRNNDSRYTDAWHPYFDTISRMVADHSITNGGNVILYQIENEYGQQWIDVDDRTPNETAIHYMELLEAAARGNGIDIPTIANAPNLRVKSWSSDYDINDEGGNTDIYTLDNYPSCWSCNLAECRSVNGVNPNFTTFDYYTHFQETAPTHPSILAEFQGGSYNPWGGPQGGCIETTGPDWVNVFYRNNIGQKIAGVNLYMLFGGTSWGGLPMPTVGTSYDYSAPISEGRMVGDKYSEAKLLSYFLRAAHDLTKLEKAGNGTSNLTGNANVFGQALQNVDTGSHFYVVKHTNTTLETRETFKLNITTSIGPLTVPQYGPDAVINGREAKILVADFMAGEQRLIYSTAEILAVSIQNKKPIVVFWVPSGESVEFQLEGVTSGSVSHCDGCSNVAFHGDDSRGVTVGLRQHAGMTVLTFDNGFTAIVVDRSVAYNLWQPMLSSDPHTPLDETLLVLGPHLVRTAALSGGILTLTGDYNGTTTVEVFAAGATGIVFNGEQIVTHVTSYGSIVGTLEPAVELPTLDISLNDWKVKDGLPERLLEYDDSGAGWRAADKNATSNPRQPDTLPVLYGDEYGFHAQNLLWRGRFRDNGTATGVFLDVIGGSSSGWSAWLNGQYLGSALGNTLISTTNGTLHFGDALLSGNNVLLVLQDNMGHDQTTGVLNPRGILNATLQGGGSFTSWRVAGKAGGQANIDPIRGAYNEGGLHAERLGWHLPGFDDSQWDAGSPQEGLDSAGVAFYRTTLPLEMPKDHDISLAFNLAAADGAKLRAQLYVNGYMFGKFVPHIGHQIEFPVFPGILNYNGSNTIGLSLWSQSQDVAAVNVSVSMLSSYKSSFDTSFDAVYLQPGWSEERLQYY